MISSVSVHGLSRISNSKSCARSAIWILFVAASSFGCFYSIVIAIIGYFEYEVTTKSRIHQVEELYFPKVTICNVNAFTTDKAYNFLQTVDKEIPYQMPHLIYAIASSNYLTYQERKELGYSLNKTLLTCSFQGAKCNEDFDWEYLSWYGNCYNFNSGLNISNNQIPLKKVNNSGFPYGLRLDLYVGAENNKSSWIRSLGARVIIEDRESLFNKKTEFFAAVGTETSIAIKKNLIKQQRYPYSFCEIEKDNLEYYKNQPILMAEFLKQGLSYSKDRCLESCYQRSLIKACKCVDLWSTHDNINYNYPSCYINNKSSTCLVEFSKSSQNIKSTCGKECPLECEKIEYTFTSSYLAYPSDSYSYTLIDHLNITERYNLNANQISKNFLALNIYFDKMEYTALTESATKTIGNLISEIGGHLGLFLGMSVLSFIEIIEISFFALSNIVKKVLKRKKITS